MAWRQELGHMEEDSRESVEVRVREENQGGGEIRN